MVDLLESMIAANVWMSQKYCFTQPFAEYFRKRCRPLWDGVDISVIRMTQLPVSMPNNNFSYKWLYKD